MTTQDAKGQPLQPGDIVLVPCTIKRTINTTDASRLDLATLASDPSTSAPVALQSLDSTQVIRDNDGDDVTFQVAQSGPTRVVLQAVAVAPSQAQVVSEVK